MATKYTEKESAALDKKLFNPTETVICPRCGKELTYRAVGTSCEVKCPTENCLYASMRGL